MPPRYTAIKDDEFNKRYQQLAKYIQDNASTLDENKLRVIQRNGLNNFLPNGHDLKNKNLFVLGENRKSFLHKAAAEGDLILITFLKSTGHDINLIDAQHKTPLYDACDALKLSAVNHLLGYDADPNLGNGHLKVNVGNQEYIGETVPLVATIESKATVTAAELSAATGEDFSQLTPKEATEQARARITKSLIAKKADVNLQTGEENFAHLHRTIINLQPETVRVFTDFKDTNFRLVDCDGQTPLHMVVDYRNLEEKQNEQAQMQKEKQITELIIPHLEAINIQDKNGNTSLHTAVICSNAEVVAAIYKNDYRFPQLKLLSIQNKEGNTAIHEAVIEAKRGPKVLAILLRVATEDDLAIINKQGETAKQLASRLTNEAKTIQNLADEVTSSADELGSLLGVEQHVSASPEIKQLQDAIEKLDNHIDHNRATDSLSVDLEGLLLDAKQHAQEASVSLADAQDLISRARNLVIDTRNEFFHENYIKSLKSVHQLEYTTWKNDLLDNASHFPNLDNIDTQSVAYQTDLTQAYTFFNLGEQFLALNNNDQARISIESAIPIYARLKNSYALERCYQSLAKIYYDESVNEGINLGGDAGETLLRKYETENKAKLLSLDYQENLQGHLALGALYKELREQKYASSFFSSDDLQAHESYHYYQAYKLTQGDPDAHAQVVLQHEMGIASDAKLGTYNIQQCVAIVAFDPISKKVVLSHFDRHSGPLSFMEQIVREFPNPQHKIELYLSGGRDRISTVSTTSPTKISDNNIDQVLKQIYAEQERFVIKAAYLADNPSPQAIVFDVQSQQLVHATPDLPDSSLPSREVNFYLQKSKADYLRPLNKVDFTQNVADRTIPFTDPAYAVQQLEIHTKVVFFNPRSDQTAAWNHQELYPFITIQNELIGSTPNFQQGLLKKALLDRYTGTPGIISNLPCIGSMRRRRDIGLCSVDSKRLLEELPELPEEEQAKALEEVSTRSVVGTKKEEVAKLTHNQKIIKHLKKVAGVSSGLMDGLFNEDALAEWIKGDPFLAIQLAGFKGLNHILEKAAAKMNAQGLKWLAEGKVLPGKWLRGTAPVLSRVGTSVFNAVDFYEEFKEYKKNGNNTDALVGMVSDGIQMGTDLVAGGVEVAEISSETFALMGFSEVTGPLSEAIVGVVMLGDKIYKTIEQVDLEEHLLHLSALKKWMEGVRLFFGFRSAYQKQIDEITQYEQILTEQLGFLKNHTEIKHVIIPGIVRTGEKKVCRRTRIFQKGCTTSYIPIFSTVETSSVYFANKLIGFKLTGEEITPPADSELLCEPTGNEKFLPEGGAYSCDGAIGLTNINSTGNIAYFNGIKYAMGFPEKINIFRITDGPAACTGGNKDDIFNIDAKAVVTGVNNQGGQDGLDGGNGTNSLMLQRFRPEKVDRIEVNLDAGCINYANKTLKIRRIGKLFGGTFPLTVTAGCDSKVIDTGGAPTQKYSDTLLIPNRNCSDALEVHLKGNIQVTNQRQRGIFTYYISPNPGLNTVNLTGTQNDANTKSLVHQFVFNAPISDVSSVAYAGKSADGQPQAIKLQLNSINASNDTLPEDSKFELHGNLVDNTSLHFIGDVEDAETSAEFRIGNNHLYLVQHNLNANVSAIVEKYALKAKEWNCICILSTKNGEQIVIGHQGKIVMNNNPDVITHLDANGGEGLFIIKSGMEYLSQSRLPINEVVLHRSPEDRQIDTLDFRSLTAQVKAQNNVTAKILFVTPNSHNNLGHDMLILFGIVTPSMRPGTVIEVINVRLKDAFLNHWYKKYLHIIFDVKAPQRIEGRHSHLHLKALPREIGPEHGLAIIGVNDVETETDLIIPQACQDGAFYRDKENLVWTNELSNRSNSIEPLPFTLILPNFFQESKLQTLSLQFTDKKIALKNKLTRLNATEEFEQASNTRLASLRAASLAIMSNQPLVSLTSHQAANASEIEVNPDQEHYLDNDIDDSNATSIEDHTDDYSNEETNEIDPYVRQRRSIDRLEKHSITNAAPRQTGIFQTSVNMISSIFNQPGKQDVTQIAHDSSQPKESLAEHINYEGTLYGNAHLGKWIASLFVPAAVKRMQKREQVLSRAEKTSNLDWAFNNLQDGIKKYGRG
ncbi:MAG: hypothetical protein RJA83_91 [Pseudomonadota bacterium]|jgi:ankyrin repeat protein